jgi:hypothetical protein
MKKRLTLSAGGTPAFQMLNTYPQGVYYQLTGAVAFANLAPVLPDAHFVSIGKMALNNS